MQLPAEDGIFLIKKAIEKTEEEKAWELWVSAFPHMDSANFTPFDKFLSNMRAGKKKANEPKITIAEAIAKAEKIRKAHQRKEG